MTHHSVPVQDGYEATCGAYLYRSVDRLVWRGPYHDAVALDIAARTHMAYMARCYLWQMATIDAYEEATELAG